MAKKEETAVAVAELVNKGTISFKRSDGTEDTLDISTAVERLRGLNDGAIITSDYLNFEQDYEKGEAVKVIFLGVKEINKMNSETEKVMALRFLMEDGSTKTNADRVLVSTCKDLEAPKPLSITWVGNKKSPKGSYKLFEVRELQ